MPAKVQVEGFLLGTEELPLRLFQERTRLLTSNPALSISLNNHQDFWLGVGACPTESTPTDTESSYHLGIEAAGGPVSKDVSIFG